MEPDIRVDGESLATKFGERFSVLDVLEERKEPRYSHSDASSRISRTFRHPLRPCREGEEGDTEARQARWLVSRVGRHCS